MEIGLQDLNPKVKALSSKVNAKEAVRNHDPHLIFIDILSSSRNGYDLCKEIKEDEYLKVFPVILLFSHFVPLDQVLFKQSQANASLEKPFRSETLRQCIKPLLPQDYQNPFQSYLEMPDMEHGMEESLATPETYRLDPRRIQQDEGPQNLEEELLKKNMVSISEIPLHPNAKTLYVEENKPTNQHKEQKTSIHPTHPTPPSYSPSNPENSKEENNLDFKIASVDTLQWEQDLSKKPKEKTNTSFHPTFPSPPPSPNDTNTQLTSNEPSPLYREELQSFLASEKFLSLIREEIHKIFSDPEKQKTLQKELQVAIERALWQTLPDKMESMIRKCIDDLTQDV